MDNQTNTQRQTEQESAPESGGCCGGARQTKPVTETGPRLVDDKKPEKAARSGCCCSGD